MMEGDPADLVTPRRQHRRQQPSRQQSDRRREERQRRERQGRQQAGSPPAGEGTLFLSRRRGVGVGWTNAVAPRPLVRPAGASRRAVPRCSTSRPGLCRQQTCHLRMPRSRAPGRQCPEIAPSAGALDERDVACFLAGQDLIDDDWSRLAQGLHQRGRPAPGDHDTAPAHDAAMSSCQPNTVTRAPTARVRRRWRRVLRPHTTMRCSGKGEATSARAIFASRREG